MKRHLAALVLASLAPAAFAGDNYFVYFGTNTGKNGSKGIYVARFNSATGALTQPELAAEAGNPGFVSIHPSKKYLYAIGDVTTAEGKKGGGISAYSIDGKTGALTLLNQQSAVGSGPLPCECGCDGQNGRAGELRQRQRGLVCDQRRGRESVGGGQFHPARRQQRRSEAPDRAARALGEFQPRQPLCFRL